MRFIVDECTGTSVAKWLREQGHEVFSVFDDAKGSTDDEILKKAASEGWILVTIDKEFGEMIFRKRQPHHGVIFMRLSDERPVRKIAVLEQLLKNYSDRIEDQFVVVSETKVRFT
jgi:predicted nuclease of predicted toxin-antitoxin system